MPLSSIKVAGNTVTIMAEMNWPQIVAVMLINNESILGEGRILLDLSSL